MGFSHPTQPPPLATHTTYRPPSHSQSLARSPQPHSFQPPPHPRAIPTLAVRASRAAEEAQLAAAKRAEMLAADSVRKPSIHESHGKWQPTRSHHKQQPAARVSSHRRSSASNGGQAEKRPRTSAVPSGNTSPNACWNAARSAYDAVLPDGRQWTTAQIRCNFQRPLRAASTRAPAPKPAPEPAPTPTLLLDAAFRR